MEVDNERQLIEALLQDREEGIEDIEKNMVEVSEIFVDLSHLVTKQGKEIGKW